MSVILPPPAFVLLKQTGKEEKLFCDDGSQRSYHNVAKNGLFSLVIGRTSSNTPSSIDFSNLGVVCTLVYDQNRTKPVEIISQKPMEYKIIPLPSKNEIRVDARIKVLSSQFEGSLFCIVIQIVDRNKNVIPSLSLYSHPIRVRSKLKSISSTSSSSSSSSSSFSQKRALMQSLGMPPLKRGRQQSADSSFSVKPEVCEEEEYDVGDDASSLRILQALERIEARQLEQQDLLEQLSLGKKLPPESSQPSLSDRTSSCGSPEDSVPNDSCTEIKTELNCFQPMNQVQPSFAEQFLHLMAVFNQMPDTQKQEQLCLIQNYATENNQHTMFSLFNNLLSSSLQQANQPESSEPDPSPVFSEDYDSFSLF